ncbi:hypothetical protein CBER1_04345 [Cercospora berteroae]|uniref:Major facilitator superfamily (MFS) profile domain-containing protein n=1 Tax=Cercospora berteroae TaxID=357750 RepID=A0A2S6CJ95_9PEZI|nr:hypothetical protein CBER1_04345 [Cercospora berteroae]
MAASTQGFPSKAYESPQADSPAASRTSSLSDIEKQEQLDSHSSQNYDTGAPLRISPSHLSQPSSPGIPDGGLTAWLQVLCGFFLFFNSWGVISSYDVFQVYYTSALVPAASASTVSWVGSVEAFMLCCTTIFAGPLVDRGFARLMVLTGTLLVVFGFMTLSLCEDSWQLMLAQGLCMGIGHGCLFITSIAIVPTYFSTKRSLAIGIAASGSSVGVVVYSIMFNRLVDVHHLPFEWTTRVLGITALATLLLPSLLVRQRRTGTKAKKCKTIDLSSFRQLPFTLFNLATFVGNIGLYVPFFYISTFGTSRAGLSSELSFYLLPILSAGSVVGRIAPASLADRVGPLNVLSVCTLVAGPFAFCWTAVTPNSTIAGLIAWSILYGAFSGAFVSLQPSTVVSIIKDMSTVGARLGLNTFCAALGLLIGTPIAGILLQEDSSWVGLQKRCKHMGDQTAAQSLEVSTAAAPKQSLIVKLPIAVRSRPGNATQLEMVKPVRPPDPSTHLSSHVLGPPPLTLPTLKLVNPFFRANATPTQSQTSAAAQLAARESSGTVDGDLDVVMQDVGASPQDAKATPSQVKDVPLADSTPTLQADVGMPSSSNRSQPKREVKQKVINALTSESGFTSTPTNAVDQTITSPFGDAEPTDHTHPRGESEAGPRFTCGVCHKEIRSPLWQACTTCLQVDFHKGCIHEGRRIHHLDFPGHRFHQVTREAAEHEENLDELIGEESPAIPLRRDSSSDYDCDECDQRITGLRHFCSTCKRVDFCDDHFTAGMKKHYAEHPGHIFDHQPSSIVKGGAIDSKAATPNAHAGAFAQDEPTRRSDTPMTGSAEHENDLFWSNGKPRQGAFTQSLIDAGRGGSASFDPKTKLPTSSRPAGKTDAMTAPPQTPRAASRATPQGKSTSSGHGEQGGATRTTRTWGRARVNGLPPPAREKTPQKKYNAAHFSAITEQLARGVSLSSTQPKTYPAERTTIDVFAGKWLHRLHGYVRNWSETSSAVHATNGLQLLSDFQVDATLNELLPTHFPDITGVVNVLRNRDYLFTNPFLAAAKAKELVRMSVGFWKRVRYHKGVVGGLSLSTLSVAQLQEIDALLGRAERLGMALAPEIITTIPPLKFLIATKNTRKTMTAIAANAFGPQESRAIFEQKWYRKTNDQISKIPLWELMNDSRDDSVLRMANWCLDTFDLIVAFESQAKDLHFVMEKKIDDHDSVYLAEWMRHFVNAIVKIYGESRSRRTVSATEAVNKLTDKVVMGELEGIWSTDEELVEAQVERVKGRVGDLGEMMNQGRHFHRQLRDYATS